MYKFFLEIISTIALSIPASKLNVVNSFRIALLRKILRPGLGGEIKISYAMQYLTNPRQLLEDYSPLKSHIFFYCLKQYPLKCFSTLPSSEKCL
jgi:hypothetical protein